MHQIVRNYANFDNFLERIKLEKCHNDSIYHAFYSIRTLYAINYFNQRVNSVQLFKVFIKSVLLMIKALFVESNFSMYRKTIILGESVQDRMVAQQLNLPAVSLHQKHSLKNFVSNFKLLSNIKKILVFCFKADINKRYLFTFIPGLIYFFTIYDKIDFKEIETIITENDLLIKEYAIIATAKKKNIRTIKIEHFIIDDIYFNTINCDTYFYPNEQTRMLREKFQSNRKVNFIKGGFVSWDRLIDFKDKTSINEPFIITFFTQHSLVNDMQIQYISDILDIINETNKFNMIIKVHPRDKTDYSKFASSKVRIVYGDGVLNYELIAQSFATFSIFSGLTLEAKHICQNSFFINYYIENSDLPIDYDVYNGSIDIVTSKEMLKEILAGNYKTTAKKVFIENFNPAFPKSCERLKELLL